MHSESPCVEWQSVRCDWERDSGYDSHTPMPVARATHGEFAATSPPEGAPGMGRQCGKELDLLACVTGYTLKWHDIMRLSQKFPKIL